MGNASDKAAGLKPIDELRGAAAGDAEHSAELARREPLAKTGEVLQGCVIVWRHPGAEPLLRCELLPSCEQVMEQVDSLGGHGAGDGLVGVYAHRRTCAGRPSVPSSTPPLRVDRLADLSLGVSLDKRAVFVYVRARCQEGKGEVAEAVRPAPIAAAKMRGTSYA